MTYIDTSSLLKLLHFEPESSAVGLAVAEESEVVVSTLTDLETRIQLKAAWRGGDCTKRQYLSLVQKVDSLRLVEPFRFVDLPGNVFRTAIRQDGEVESRHLRSLDRLHLAAMEELGLICLLTNDRKQAAAAKAMGLKVIVPGQD